MSDDIPPASHPNCKCYIDVIAVNKDTTPVNKPDTNKTDWIMPCNGKIVGIYGEQRSTHVHNGIDIAVPIGTPVKAIADGIVTNVGSATGYGYWVVINHGKVNGEVVTSEYGHISSWNVKVGQKVTKGQIVAKSGNTGRSQGPHVHLTIRKGVYPNQKTVDPYEYINRY